MGFEQLSKIDLAKQKLMTPQEYAEVSHETPYIFEIEKGGKRLTYFGSPHANGPRDRLFDGIEAHYVSAKPDAVLVEGFPAMRGREKEHRQWMASLPREEAIRLGESAFVLWLACRDGKDVKSPEPRLEDEIGHLESRGCSREEIFVFLTARSLEHFQRLEDRREEAKTYLQAYLDSIAKAAHWDGFQFTFDNFVVLYRNITGRDFDLSDPSFAEVVSPIPRPDTPLRTRINEVAEASSRLRDLQVIEEVGRALQSHNNLFVIYGASHAVMQRPAMEALLG